MNSQAVTLSISVHKDPIPAKPVMEPFPDKEGMGWHIVIRYREGHERLIEGFATESEAVDWIIANASGQQCDF